MKISGFTLVRNGSRFDYPYLESLRSLLPLVDELIINVGIGDDDTLEQIKSFAQKEGQGKVQWFESEWPLNDPEKKKSGLILSEQTNLALERCSGDWCIYLQADEVFHEADHSKILKAIHGAQADPQIDGILFDYIHFYGSYDVIQQTRSAYRREVRAIRRSSGAQSIGDAQSFRKPHGSKLRVLYSGANVYHYGWVRPPEAMREKTFFMDQLYHGEPDSKDAQEGRPHSGDNYRYKRIIGLKRFTGLHPFVMRLRIAQKNWNWDLENSPLVWSFKDLKKVVLDAIEKLTGKRLFEYRSYRLAATYQQLDQLPAYPAASLVVATYEMPKHLALVCAALENQTFRDFEVLFCDDGSGPETAQIIREFQRRTGLAVRHLWQEHHGFRKCRILNQALREACGETMIFLDGDCVPHKRYVEDHVRNQGHGYYLAGRRVELGPKFSQFLTPDLIRKGYLDRPRFKLFKSCMEKDSVHFQRTIRHPFGWLRRLLGMEKIDDLKGCNYSVSRSVLIELNGFDETYEGYGREDTDIELRMQHLGLKIKSMKGLALQYHVWHPRLAFTPANDQRLDEVKKLRKIRCEQGLLRL